MVTPSMRKLLLFVLALFALLVVNSAYLGAITYREWLTGESLEDAVYLSMFLGHLLLGLTITVPVLVYGVMHLRRAIGRPNRLAVRLGLALFGCVILLLATGFGLTRGIPLVELRDPALRSAAYWAHIATPLLIAWLFVLHRLAGRRIRWSAGLGIGAASLAVGILSLWLVEPRQDDTDGEADFLPALARTSTGGHIVPAELMRDDECARCHPDAHAQWQYSAHRFASFNNPAYLFSVRNTRASVLARDGNVHAARFCAGCHDPVPLFSGRFDDPEFDDVHDPTAHAGITCVSCHAIEAIGSVRGNADFVIGVPERYPFSRSDQPIASWLNGFLIKAKPALHKRTFLKPLHKSAEFCGTCHKVHLPVALNHYKWLRGQNHYDAFLLSGVSGHGVTSFYYPPKAEENCNRCHMPLLESDDFAAKRNDDSGALTVHGHHFPAANTALAHLLGFPESVNEAHREFLEGSLRVDIFGIRAGTAIDAPLTAPLRPEVPALAPGGEYVLEVVLRTLTLGHTFTQGTADSNEVWLEVAATSGERLIGISGGRNPIDGAVDPYSHFVNAYVLDRDGNRIDRRNAEDIFTPLYNHQLPPGAASVAHYRLTVPQDLDAPLVVTARLHYRKFDTIYMRHFQGEAFAGNTLPTTTIATDEVAFPVAAAQRQGAPDIPVWQRWNDYGIGLLAKPDRGALRQAEAAFGQVAELGRAEGDLNLARVLIREGRLGEAGEALRRAAANGAYPWSVAWFGALVDLQNGEFDAAIESLTALLETRFEEARRRGFDFSRDYRALNTLGRALFERAKLPSSPDAERQWLEAAADRYRQALAIDPENVTAHYGMAQVAARLGDEATEDRHRRLHEQYRPDDNAKDRAIAAARRRDPAANHAAEAVVVYDLQRPGAFGLGETSQ
ncbi:MAG: tetratricopeptide repeat protein [Gammaproteobacteria bacterium]|nr:tetratricopeptide repeat protein [Gammaproteobacteria bacterium]